MHGSKLNQEALTEYVRSFSSIVLDDFFSKNDGISGQQIISLTPLKQVNFFVLKVLFDQWQEETIKFKSPFFNYKNTEVNHALKNLVNTLSKNILIDKEDLRPLLEKATKETLTLLFSPLDYYLGQIESLTQNKELRADSKYIKLYKPLYQNVVLAIEHDAGTDLKALISDVVDEDSIDKNEQQDTTHAFNEILLLNIHEKEPTSIVYPEEGNVTEAVDAPNPEDAIVEKTSINGHDTPLDEEIKSEFTPLEQSPAQTEEHGSSVNEQFAEEQIQTLNQRFETEERKNTIAAQHETKAVSDLIASISINQRYMFISDLFNGDESDYSAALTEVEASDSFDESVEILVQNYSKKYAWDMNSDEVKELLKIIFKRFR